MKIELDVPKQIVEQLREMAKSQNEALEEWCLGAIRARSGGTMALLPDGVEVKMQALPSGKVSAVYRETFLGQEIAAIIENTVRALDGIPGLAVTSGKNWIRWEGEFTRELFAQMMVMEFGNWTPIMSMRLRDAFLAVAFGQQCG